MENSIYLGLSRQLTLQTNLDIVANNIANVNTNGFRAQAPMFEEYLSDPRGNGDPRLHDCTGHGSERVWWRAGRNTATACEASH